MLFNGSPRGQASNTRLLLDAFACGFTRSGRHTVEWVDLANSVSIEAGIDGLVKADRVILAFPLYTDAMPGIVKTFIESLVPLRGKVDIPPLGFIVHSGFPEPIHSRALEMYLDKLCRRLGCRSLGTVIKGNSERLRQQPPWMTRTVIDRFRKLGIEMAVTGSFDTGIQAQIAGRETITPFALGIFRLLNLFGLTTRSWDQKMRRNGAFAKRFARPYLNGGVVPQGGHWPQMERNNEVLR